MVAILVQGGQVSVKLSLQDLLFGFTKNASTLTGESFSAAQILIISLLVPVGISPPDAIVTSTFIGSS